MKKSIIVSICLVISVVLLSALKIFYVTDQKKNDIVVDSFNNVCPQSIVEYGEISSSKDVLVYVTTCVNRDTDLSIARVYVRSIEGSFNRKIYSTLYASLQSPVEVVADEHKIRIYDEVSGTKAVDIYGEDVQDVIYSAESEKEIEYGALSPDGLYRATSGRGIDYPPEYPPIESGHLQIKNIQTGVADEYDFSSSTNRLNGFGFQWAEDSKSMYIYSGGPYECLYAEPFLWKLDVMSKEIRKYELPPEVIVNPDSEHNIAFLSEYYNCGESDDRDEFSHYMLDLTTGKFEKIATGNLSGGFLARIRNDVIFLDHDDMKKINLETGVVSDFPEKLYLLEPIVLKSKNDDWIIVMNQGGYRDSPYYLTYRLIFIDSDSEQLIGEAYRPLPADVEGKEYILRIEGVIEADR